MDEPITFFEGSIAYKVFRTIQDYRSGIRCKEVAQLADLETMQVSNAIHRMVKKNVLTKSGMKNKTIYKIHPDLPEYEVLEGPGGGAGDKPSQKRKDKKDRRNRDKKDMFAIHVNKKGEHIEMFPACELKERIDDPDKCKMDFNEGDEIWVMHKIKVHPVFVEVKKFYHIGLK